MKTKCRFFNRGANHHKAIFVIIVIVSIEIRYVITFSSAVNYVHKGKFVKTHFIFHFSHFNCWLLFVLLHVDYWAITAENHWQPCKLTCHVTCQNISDILLMDHDPCLTFDPVTAQWRRFKLNILKTGDLQHAANVVTYVVINQFWKEKWKKSVCYFKEEKKKSGRNVFPEKAMQLELVLAWNLKSVYSTPPSLQSSCYHMLRFAMPRTALQVLSVRIILKLQT